MGLAGPAEGAEATPVVGGPNARLRIGHFLGRTLVGFTGV